MCYEWGGGGGGGAPGKKHRPSYAGQLSHGGTPINFVLGWLRKRTKTKELRVIVLKVLKYNYMQLLDTKFYF